MRWAGLGCLLVIGCSFHHGSLQTSGGADANDARPIDTLGIDACITYSNQFDTCSVGVGGGALVLSGMNTYNTDTNMLVTPGGTMNPSHEIVTGMAGPIDVLLVSSFTLETGAILRVTGVNNNVPFGIAATGAVQIDGLIDLTSNGAGARDDAACFNSDGERGADLVGGGSGGGGGAFQGAGGKGANGNKNGTESVGAAAGIALTNRPLGPLGGCDGGGGGNGQGNGGEGGNGGGAILIASGTSISLGAAGVINVGGGGGRGGIGGTGDDGGGAGGGGSGGMIVLESSTVMLAGRLAANGGGGGEGGDTVDGEPGTTGGTTTTRAPGGSGNGKEGGDGAAGGSGTNLSGINATQLKNGGGGGGGGGVGFIAIGPATPVISGAIITPPHGAWP